MVRFSACYPDPPMQEGHFEEEHYVCLHPECRGAFIAFSTEIALQAHEVHGDQSCATAPAPPPRPPLGARLLSMVSARAPGNGEYGPAHMMLTRRVPICGASAPHNRIPPSR